MDARSSLWKAVICIAVAATAARGAEAPARQEVASVPCFQLTDGAGKVVEVAPQEGPGFTVVCFLGTECPLARKYAPRLSALANEFAAKKVRFIGINSNSQDTQKEVDAFVAEHKMTVPVLKDPGNRIADQFGARYVAEVFVLDHTLSVRYRGRIDDQYLPGISRGEPTRHDLKIALEELLAGRPVTVAQTEPEGCMIGRVRRPANDAAVTFCRDVSRILNQHCVECHRPEDIGPFSLTDYNEVTGWGETILETIDSGRMPPWNANPEFGHFRNARTMPEPDKQVLRDWVAAGMPYGEPADLPPAPEFSSGWQLPREPDLVLEMRDRPFHVPAEGTIEYQYFVVDPHFEEDRWISAAQVIPGSRQTVHHCIVFVRPPDGAEVRGVGYLTGYVPGQRSFSMPPGYARRVPAGSKLVFQMHYTPNGSEQDDLTKLGINWIPESEVTHEVVTLLGIDQEFEIPPHAASFPVHSEVRWFPRQAELLAIVPHMHVRGKAFRATMTQDSQANVLLDVPRYDFNWQHVYEMSQPLPLKDIDRLEFTATFDNSADNPANPDPTQTVTWGDQTWEEMAIAFFEVSVPRNVPEEAEPPRNRQQLVMASAAEKDGPESAAEFTSEFFRKFDQNQDGVVEENETPLVFRRYAFRRFDENRDGQLSREEILTAAQRQQRK